MKSPTNWIAVTFFLAFVAAGCEEDPIPSIFNPADPGAPSPAITSVTPESLATGGVTEVVIAGTNFSDQPAGNVVYFGSTKGTIVSQTTTQISVVPPLMVADDLTIQVVVSGAIATATYGPYQLEGVGLEYGNFGNLDEVYTVAVDRDENLFVHVRTSGVSRVMFLPAAGGRDTITTTSFPKASQINIGNGGDLYLLQSSSANMFRLPAGSSTIVPFATLPTGTRVSFFDFDSLGNIYAAGNESGLYAIHPDGTFMIVGSYSMFDVKSVRVYNGYVYVAALYTGTDTTIAPSGIWRNQILGTDGTLGTAEEVFDWANAGDHAASAFFSITFSSEGDIYVGTDHVDPVLIVKTDGTTETLFAGLLQPTAGALVWGTGTYLYQNRTSTSVDIRRLIRISVGKTGAPYYGR